MYTRISGLKNSVPHLNKHQSNATEQFKQGTALRVQPLGLRMQGLLAVQICVSFIVISETLRILRAADPQYSHSNRVYTRKTQSRNRPWRPIGL
jgi:hypothetical protein